MNQLEEYLRLTGQTRQYVLGGASSYGPTFIIDELVPKTLAEKKKIVWITRLIDGEDVGLVRWELHDIQITK